jgi:hypothetical protein
MEVPSREHPIGPWIADFACVSKRLVVEVDGGYQDQNTEKDVERQQDLERLAWTVVRFTAQDVEQNAESVARAIAAAVKVEFDFTARMKTGSGKFNIRAKKPKVKQQIAPALPGRITADPPASGRVS